MKPSGSRASLRAIKDGGLFRLQQHIELDADTQGKGRCVGIDPGARTFATCFTRHEALVVGDNFAKEKLFPLMNWVDKLIGQRQNILNTQKGDCSSDIPKWARDRMVHFDYEITHSSVKRMILSWIYTTAWRSSWCLIMTLIFLPSFETKGKVRRKDKKFCTIRRNTYR